MLLKAANAPLQQPRPSGAKDKLRKISKVMKMIKQKVMVEVEVALDWLIHVRLTNGKKAL